MIGVKSSGNFVGKCYGGFSMQQQCIMDTTKSCLPKQLLLELTSLDELSFPVAFSSRIKVSTFAKRK